MGVEAVGRLYVGGCGGRMGVADCAEGLFVEGCGGRIGGRLWVGGMTGVEACAGRFWFWNCGGRMGAPAGCGRVGAAGSGGRIDDEGGRLLLEWIVYGVELADMSVQLSGEEA